MAHAPPKSGSLSNSSLHITDYTKYIPEGRYHALIICIFFPPSPSFLQHTHTHAHAHTRTRTHTHTPPLKEVLPATKVTYVGTCLSTTSLAWSKQRHSRWPWHSPTKFTKKWKLLDLESRIPWTRLQRKN